MRRWWNRSEMLRRSRGGDAKETVAGAKEAAEQEEAEQEEAEGANCQCKGDGSGGRREEGAMRQLGWTVDAGGGGGDDGS